MIRQGSEKARRADAATAPKVLSDVRGDYLLCPHCGTRIAMKRIRIADRDSFKPQA